MFSFIVVSPINVLPAYETRSFGHKVLSHRNKAGTQFS